nr:chromatin remodeling protein EBS-like [Tanacetum cinerariifolium]
MAKTKPGKKDCDSYTIRGTDKFVRPGDCVLMRPSDFDKPPYVARVEKLEADHRNNVKVKARCRRRQFHGVKELFLSDHYDMQSAHTIEGMCIVHSFKNYKKLDNVGTEDYFCQFEYKAATGCEDWFHPNCMGMTIEEAKKLELFMCAECTSDDDTKRPLDAIPESPSSDGTVKEYQEKDKIRSKPDKNGRRDQDGNLKIRPPVTAEEHQQVQQEEKARTILLSALPNEHMGDFYHMIDARDIWNAIKARFGGNAESKKMQKYLLKQRVSVSAGDVVVAA